MFLPGVNIPATPRRALLLALTALLPGCRPAPLRLGTFDPAAARASITEVARQPQTFAGKRIDVAGRITRVCPHVGCWFYVTDGSREIYVDLQGGLLFVIPTHSAGRQARVVGAVRLDGGEPRLVAQGVELR